MIQFGWCVFALFITTGFASAAQPFRPDRCGVEFPRMPENRTVAPSGSFTGTFPSGITNTYWPLICKGGPGLDVINTFSLTNREGTGPASLSLEMHFKKSRISAGTNGASLAPGECAWVDRPLSSTEPNQVVELYQYEVPQLAIKSSVDSSGRLNHVTYPANQKFSRALSTGVRFVLYVTNQREAPQMQAVPFCWGPSGRVAGHGFYVLE